MKDSIYTNRKNATKKLAEARIIHNEALREVDTANDDFFRTVASIIRANARGELNAQPAMYFARFLSDDPDEQRAIATSIGNCGRVIDEDISTNELPSDGYSQRFLSKLRRKDFIKTIRWAEIDEKGNVTGKIHERQKETYLYYWKD